MTPRPLRACLAAAASAAIAASAAAAAPPTADVSYRPFRIAIDGASDDWRGSTFSRRFAETSAPATRFANRVEVRLAWDLDGLCALIDVVDHDVVAAPVPLDADQFHQVDSLQIYLDGGGEAGARMDDNDYDLLLLPDGRYAALRGDSLLGDLAGATVPQREQALPIDYAVQATPDGWIAELRIPWAVLGVRPHSGRELGIDVAMNDWFVAHPTKPGEAMTTERVRAAIGEESPVRKTTAADPMLPLNWSGERDFGYPNRWQRIRLAGDAPWWQRTLRREAYLPLIVLVVLGASLPIVAISGWLLVRQRRRLRELVAMLAQAGCARADAASSHVAQADAAPTPREGDDAPVVVRDREFVERLVAYIGTHLDEPLTPAGLAAQFHVSLRTLQRRVRSALRTRPQDLILAARLDRARALLASGQHRIGDVASCVGFDDVSHFSRRFRAVFGVAPSNWRASNERLESAS